MRNRPRDTELAMSQENVDLVLDCAAAINARQVPSELVAPDLRLENVSTAVTDKTYRGVEGFGEWISDFFDVLDEDARHEAEPIAVGEDYVVAKLRIVGHGAGSGAPVHALVRRHVDPRPKAGARGWVCDPTRSPRSRGAAGVRPPAPALREKELQSGVVLSQFPHFHEPVPGPASKPRPR
jgi:hypothetical protein